MIKILSYNSCFIFLCNGLANRVIVCISKPKKYTFVEKERKRKKPLQNTNDILVLINRKKFILIYFFFDLRLSSTISHKFLRRNFYYSKIYLFKMRNSYFIIHLSAIYSF